MASPVASKLPAGIAPPALPPSFPAPRVLPGILGLPPPPPAPAAAPRRASLVQLPPGPPPTSAAGIDAHASPPHAAITPVGAPFAVHPGGPPPGAPPGAPSGAASKSSAPKAAPPPGQPPSGSPRQSITTPAIAGTSSPPAGKPLAAARPPGGPPPGRPSFASAPASAPTVTANPTEVALSNQLPPESATGDMPNLAPTQNVATEAAASSAASEGTAAAVSSITHVEHLPTTQSPVAHMRNDTAEITAITSGSALATAHDPSETQLAESASVLSNDASSSTLPAQPHVSASHDSSRASTVSPAQTERNDVATDPATHSSASADIALHATSTANLIPKDEVHINQSAPSLSDAGLQQTKAIDVPEPVVNDAPKQAFANQALSETKSNEGSVASSSDADPAIAPASSASDILQTGDENLPQPVLSPPAHEALQTAPSGAISSPSINAAPFEAPALVSLSDSSKAASMQETPSNSDQPVADNSDTVVLQRTHDTNQVNLAAVDVVPLHQGEVQKDVIGVAADGSEEPLKQDAALSTDSLLASNKEEAQGAPATVESDKPQVGKLASPFLKSPAVSKTGQGVANPTAAVGTAADKPKIGNKWPLASSTNDSKSATPKTPSGNGSTGNMAGKFGGTIKSAKPADAVPVSNTPAWMNKALKSTAADKSGAPAPQDRDGDVTPNDSKGAPHTPDEKQTSEPTTEVVVESVPDKQALPAAESTRLAQNQEGAIQQLAEEMLVTTNAVEPTQQSPVCETTKELVGSSTAPPVVTEPVPQLQADESAGVPAASGMHSASHKNATPEIHLTSSLASIQHALQGAPEMVLYALHPQISPRSRLSVQRLDAAIVSTPPSITPSAAPVESFASAAKASRAQLLESSGILEAATTLGRPLSYGSPRQSSVISPTSARSGKSLQQLYSRMSINHGEQATVDLQKQTAPIHQGDSVSTAPPSPPDMAPQAPVIRSPVTSPKEHMVDVPAVQLPSPDVAARYGYQSIDSLLSYAQMHMNMQERLRTAGSDVARGFVTARTTVGSPSSPARGGAVDVAIPLRNSSTRQVEGSPRSLRASLSTLDDALEYEAQLLSADRTPGHTKPHLVGSPVAVAHVRVDSHTNINLQSLSPASSGLPIKFVVSPRKPAVHS